MAASTNVRQTQQSLLCLLRAVATHAWNNFLQAGPTRAAAAEVGGFNTSNGVLPASITCTSSSPIYFPFPNTSLTSFFSPPADAFVQCSLHWLSCSAQSGVRSSVFVAGTNLLGQLRDVVCGELLCVRLLSSHRPATIAWTACVFLLP